MSQLNPAEALAIQLEIPTPGVYVINRNRVWTATKVAAPISHTRRMARIWIPLRQLTSNDVELKTFISCCEWVELVRKRRVFKLICVEMYRASAFARLMNRETLDTFGVRKFTPKMQLIESGREVRLYFQNKAHICLMLHRSTGTPV